MNRQDGPLLVRGFGLQIPLYDYLVNTPTSLTDVYVFKIGGASGTVVCTITIVYTDTDKDTISTVTRVPQLPWNA